MSSVNNHSHERHGSPAPHEEQRRYWSRDLHYKRIALAISAAGFLLIVAGLVATIRQISINTGQLRLNTMQAEKVAKSVRINVGNALTSHVTKLDELFISDPSLTPYFYEGKELSKTDKDYPKVSATAVIVLDVFDLVVTQNRNFPEFWSEPEGWDNWVIDVFSTSPILRETLDKHPTWYDTDLKGLRKKGEEKMRAAQNQPASGK